MEETLASEGAGARAKNLRISKLIFWGGALGGNGMFVIIHKVKPKVGAKRLFEV
jgi:hypothetical protein